MRRRDGDLTEPVASLRAGGFDQPGVSPAAEDRGV